MESVIVGVSQTQQGTLPTWCILKIRTYHWNTAIWLMRAKVANTMHWSSNKICSLALLAIKDAASAFQQSVACDLLASSNLFGCSFSYCQPQSYWSNGVQHRMFRHLNHSHFLSLFGGSSNFHNSFLSAHIFDSFAAEVLVFANASFLVTYSRYFQWVCHLSGIWLEASFSSEDHQFTSIWWWNVQNLLDID